MSAEEPSMCNTIRLPTSYDFRPHVDQSNRGGSSNRGYWLNGLPEVDMVTG